VSTPLDERRTSRVAASAHGASKHFTPLFHEIHTTPHHGHFVTSL
jgi:hypothetical protein